MLHDLRFALRMLRRAPGFAAMAVLVLALGIGANTAIFSLVNAILLERLPFTQPEQLVRMYETEEAPGSFPLSGPDFPDWQAQSHLFAGMTLADYERNVNLGGSGAPPQRVTAQPVEDNYFRLLGTQAALGRTFLPGESRPGRNQVAILSYPLWQSRFAGDPGVIGRSIMLDGLTYSIVGVAPADFRLAPRIQLWTALNMASGALGQRGNHSYSAIGRMKPGVTLAQAQAEIAAIAARLARQYPNSNTDIGARLILLRDALVGTNQRASLWTLMAVVGVVLLIACANLANLLLARALGRQREMAVRLALGARRGHILRQLLTESVLLALSGAALGALLAEAVVRSVSSLPLFPLPQFNALDVNLPVLAFTALLAVLCGLLFGLAPALQLSRPRLADELTAGASTPAGGRRRWLSDSLIVGEIALAMVLVAAAALFLQSFARLRGQPLGFDPNHLLTAGVTLPDAAYNTPARTIAFQHAFLKKLQALPGVEAASFSSELPIEGGSNGYIRLAGHSQDERALVEWTRVTLSYFQTMGIPLVAGRPYSRANQQAWEAFSQGAKPASLPVIVNQAFVKHFLPGQNPLNQRFYENGVLLVIQGVARDVPIDGLANRPLAQSYFPELAEYNFFHIELRSALPQATLMAEAQRALASLDPTLPLYNPRSMNHVADTSVGAASLQRWLIAAFAAIALLLAAAGIYGVMAYLVAVRTREIGVRMALGATRGAVLRLIVGHGMALAAAGVTIGACAALGSGQLIASQLYGVAARNPATLAAAAVILLAASFLACVLPARRAASVDPNLALRCN